MSNMSNIKYLAVLILFNLIWQCYTVSFHKNTSENKLTSSNRDVINMLLKQQNEIKSNLGRVMQENAKMKQQLRILTQNTAEMTQNYYDLKDKYEDLHQNMCTLKENTQLQIKNEIAKTEDICKKRSCEFNANATGDTVRRETPIAFTMHTPPASSGEAGFEGTLQFGVTVINLGNYYDTSTGQFVCPVRGLYLFAYSVLAYSLKDEVSYIFAYLRVNGANTVHTDCQHDGPDSAEISCNGIAILQLDVASQVEVYKRGPGSTQASSYTYFTGFLIQPM